ncbi:MAG: DUF881 domain-containing protein [Micrococcales bacterium]|nr:DUF881 domain-containing protein [Micrococcales bacterium]
MAHDGRMPRDDAAPTPPPSGGATAAGPTQRTTQFVVRNRQAVRSWLTHRPSKWSVLVPFIALIAGLLFATSATTANGTDLRSEQAGLVDLVRERDREQKEQTLRVARLRSEVDGLVAKAAPGDERLTAAQTALAQTSSEADLQAVQGPSLKVSLDDSPLTGDTLPEGMTVDDIVVHQQDVQAVVNAMWRGGAEAMMLMDQRVVSTSAVRCVGNTLILQGRVYSPPFTIRAIGDTEGMRRALTDDPQVKVYREYVDAVDLGYQVEDEGEQTFPGYAGQTDLHFARAGAR